MKALRATIDFETRSACNLKQCGSWRYSLDPTTEPLCMAFHLPSWPESTVVLWHPAFPHLGIEESLDDDPLCDLFDWIFFGGLVEAHNAWFERGIWTNIMTPRFRWPPVPVHQWRCSAAKAAVHSLPRALDDATSALNLSVQKDEAGYIVMRKVTSPRKPLKADIQAWQNTHNAGVCPTCKGRGTTRKVVCTPCAGTGALSQSVKTVPPIPRLWHESPALFEQLWAYCQQDVLAEKSLSAALPDLSPAETDVYLLDQTINQRGFYLDQDAVTRALELIHDETLYLNDRITQLTQGQVTKGTQRQRMTQWFDQQGLQLENTQAITIDDALTDKHLSAPVHEGLSLMRELGRSSTAKYTTMQRWLCPDNRVHGGLLYHGAGTGRWSGAGVQPQNFVRGGTLKLSQQEIWEDLQSGDRELVRGAYGSVMLLLSEGLRGVICATPGYQLYVADYAAIEARVLLWFAEDEAGLDIFRRGEDIYCEMASAIYHRPITKQNAKERQLGKATILGCGYQMGGSKFVSTVAAYGVEIDEDFAIQVVATYREKFWRVKQLWEDQEAAALKTLKTRKPILCGRITWIPTKWFLYCLLPSGRRIAYPEAEIRPRLMPWGDMKMGLTYKGVNSYTRQWQRQHAYGGMLVENMVQAMARDILAEALLRCEQSKTYIPVLSIHDEVLCESPLGAGTLEEFTALLTALPRWANGLPIAAEAWRGIRYKK